MSVYLDTSVLVSMWVQDAHSEYIDHWCAGLDEPMLVSNWAAAEFTSALGARQRNASLTPEESESAELALDGWLAAGVDTIDLVAADVSLARRLMRASSTPLKAPDALHLAATRRTGATLATLDRPLQRAAESLGLATVDFGAFG